MASRFEPATLRNAHDCALLPVIPFCKLERQRFVWRLWQFGHVRVRSDVLHQGRTYCEALAAMLNWDCHGYRTHTVLRKCTNGRPRDAYAAYDRNPSLIVLD